MSPFSLAFLTSASASCFVSSSSSSGSNGFMKRLTFLITMSVCTGSQPSYRDKGGGEMGTTLGLSLVSVGAVSMRSSTSIPPTTRPNTLCLLSKCWAGLKRMKLNIDAHLDKQLVKTQQVHQPLQIKTYNCEVFVLGPALAMLRMPRPLCLRVCTISSLSGLPHADLPPVPVPVGSPPWI